MSAKAKRILITTESREVWTVRHYGEQFDTASSGDPSNVCSDAELALLMDEGADRHEIEIQSLAEHESGRTIGARGVTAELWKATKAFLTR